MGEITLEGTVETITQYVTKNNEVLAVLTLVQDVRLVVLPATWQAIKGAVSVGECVTLVCQHHLATDDIVVTGVAHDTV